MKGTHHEEDIAEVIIPVLREYKLLLNLGVFIADNVDSNDSVIQATLSVLRPDLNAASRRSRCLGHIINLAAKAFLFGKETAAFEEAVESVDEVDEATESTKMKKAQELWRKRGPIGKFHNLVVYIRSSSQRREAFKQCLVGGSNDDLMVILDNSTRWNSTYYSIKRGLKLKERLMVYSSLNKAHISDDYLSDADWDHLQEIATALEPFEEVTIQTEGRATKGYYGAVWETLPTLEGLLSFMEAGRHDLDSRQQGKTPLAIAYQNAWEKLIKYYNKTDDSHSIYAAATLLHPSFRKKYFDENWTGESAAWKDKMISNVKKVWEQEYSTIPGEQLPIKKMSFVQKQLNKGQMQTSGDLFDSYINAPTSDPTSDTHEGLITWWMNEKNPWRGLRQMALDLLSIPAMSAEVERVFSSAKRLLTSDRNRMNEDSIEETQLLKHWWSNELILKQLRQEGRVSTPLPVLQSPRIA
jgi:hypothetical protein